MHLLFRCGRRRSIRTREIPGFETLASGSVVAPAFGRVVHRTTATSHAKSQSEFLQDTVDFTHKQHVRHDRRCSRRKSG